MNQQEAHDAQIRKEAIREGIKMERERVIRLLTSGKYKMEPAQDMAHIIGNGIHWGEL